MNLPGASILRYYDIGKLNQKLLNNDPLFNRSSSDYQVRISEQIYENINNWIDLNGYLMGHPDSYKKRIEGHWIDFYSNDRQFYDEMISKFSSMINVAYSPEQGTENTLLDANREIFVKKLPYDQYQYKVFLKPSGINDSNDRIKVADWLNKLKPNITFSTAVRRWFLSPPYWDRRYILCDSDQTLLMIQLRAPQILGHVYKYVVNR